MASFNDLLEASAAPPTVVCSVQKWRETLNPADRTQFDAAAADPSIPHTTLWRAMRGLGYEPGSSAVQRHRSGGCKCPPSPTS